MTTIISAFTRAARRIRRSMNRIADRLTRKASIKLAITVSLPPFLKVALDYTADIGKAANENRPRRKTRRAA